MLLSPLGPVVSNDVAGSLRPSQLGAALDTTAVAGGAAVTAAAALADIRRALASGVVTARTIHWLIDGVLGEMQLSSGPLEYIGKCS